MTKGVGFLPLLVLLPWAGLRWAGWPLPSLGGRARWLLGPLAFCAPLACWLVPLALLSAGDPKIAAYLDNLLFRQTVTRYANPWGHVQPFWYYFVEVIPCAWFPLVLLAPWLAVRWKRRCRDRDAVTSSLLLWIGLVLLFFTISPGKRDVYLLPLAPALALVAAPHLPELLKQASCRRVLWAAALAVCLGLGVAAGWLLWGDPERLVALQAKYDTSTAPVWALLVVTVAGGGVLILAMRARRVTLALFLFVGWQLWGWVLQPQINDIRSGRRVAARALEQLPGDASLALVAWRAQQILHLDRPVIHFQGQGAKRRMEIEQAAAWLAEDGARRLLMPAKHIGACFRAGSGSYLGHAHRRDWLLLSRDDLSGACSAPADPVHLVRLPRLRPWPAWMSQRPGTRGPRQSG